MNRLSVVLALMLCVMAPAVVRAQAVSPEEIAFWKSVSATNNPVELQAYLDAYPQGVFAAIARNRLHGAQGAAGLPTPMPSPTLPQVAQPTTALARVVPIRASFRRVDGVTLDLDATGVRNASNLRLVVVPANMPLAVSDPNRLVRDSTPVSATRLRLTIPAGPPGADEVRLYYIPNTGSEYRLAARVPVTIEPGFAGATLVRELGRELGEVGPVRFEANHRDHPMLIEGAFLREMPAAEWSTQIFQGVAVDVGRQTLLMMIGQPNATPDIYGSLGEAVCVIAVADPATLNYAAGLRVGTPVLVSAVPTAWVNSEPSNPIVLNNCKIEK